jgi:hypothetical protein
VYPSTIARQWLSKNATAAMNTHATIGELLHVSFSMCFISYQRKVDDQFFPELSVSLFHCIQTSSAVWLGFKTNHSPPPNAEVKNGTAIPPFPNTSSWHGA